MTVDFELHLGSVKTNQRTKYTGQRSFKSKVIGQTRRETDTHDTCHTDCSTWTTKLVGPRCCWAALYAIRVACCPLVSHGEYADGTDRRTEARLLHNAFR